MLRENHNPSGGLDSDRFLIALLTYRNTPDRDTGRSPAQIIFGHPIKDFFPVRPQNFRPRPEWFLTAEQREIALARRHAKQGAVLTEHTKVLRSLSMSDIVLVQNQAGRRGKKWDKTGVVIEVLDHDQYRIRMDGTGRPTLRNRRFLKPITPFNGHTRQSIDLSPPQARNQPLVQVADDQHFYHEDIGHTAEQFLPTNQPTGFSTPVEHMLYPTPDPTPPRAPHVESTSVLVPPPSQQLDEPAVRRSGRKRKMNTRLLNYELGSIFVK